MTTENEKSSHAVVDPADMTGIELYDHLSKRFYPLVRFHREAGLVNVYVRQLENQVADQYPESNLQRDLSQNHQKLLALRDFLSNFEPLPEVKSR